MNYKKWIEKNAENLKGKTVAVTGTTGGLGKEICLFLGELNANLILVDRNLDLSNDFKKELTAKFSNIGVECVKADLQDFNSVIEATKILKERSIDVFIHNAGAYSIPRRICDTGFDNVFQINFVSPYYMIKQLLENLRKLNGKVVIVSSIAHNYSKIDLNDVDFKTRKQSSLVYGNSKRFLTFSLLELFKNESKVSLSVAHPGITFTKITNHYPKMIFALIKNPMKVIFMKPKKACLSVIKSIFIKCNFSEWVGPKFFDVWGKPTVKKLKTASNDERTEIFNVSEKIYNKLKQKAEGN